MLPLQFGLGLGMFSKLVAAVATTSVMFCGAALSADLPARPSVYANPNPVWSWEGFYAGVHGGYASGDVDVFVGGGGPGAGSPKGGFGGFQLGYNYLVTPSWLLGYEVDASFGDINDATAPFAGSNFKVDAFGTGRGRLGYVHGPWLLYGTFGMAWAKPNWTVPGVDNTRANIGWAGGLGVEYAFAPNWSAKVEYLYADFGETRRTVGGGPLNTDLTMSMVRAGLNYHFAGFGRKATAAPAEPAGATTVWNGPYIGLHGGYGWGDFKSTVPGVTTSLDPAGAFGGFQGGYNWQFAPRWMLGIESDSSWGSLKESGGANKVEIDATGTIRGRLGYTMNKTLVYGTGGLAWGHVDSTTATGGIVSDHYLLGWTAGAGVEYRFAPRWSAKLEYAYMDFPDLRETAGIVIHDKLDIHTVKIGLNYQASLLSLFTGH
jgi:outer membrane immunogenic protein